MALLAKPRPWSIHFPGFAYFHIFVPKVHILSGFESFTILLENVMEMCYSFSWPSIDLISKGRRLNPSDPGRFNSLVISSIYGVDYPFVF